MPFIAYENASPQMQISTSPQEDHNLSETPKKPYKPHKNKRIASSCSNCQKRRVRCDRIQPCTSCCSKGLAKNCAYALDRGPMQQATLIKKLRRENETLRLENDSLKTFLQQENKSSNAAPSASTHDNLPDSKKINDSALKPTSSSDIQRLSSNHKDSDYDNLPKFYQFKLTHPWAPIPKEKASRTTASSESDGRKANKKPKLSGPEARSLGNSIPKSSQDDEGSKRVEQKQQLSPMTMKSKTRALQSTHLALDCIARTGNSVRIIKEAITPPAKTNTGTQDFSERCTQESKISPDPDTIPTKSLKDEARINTPKKNFSRGAAFLTSSAFSEAKPEPTTTSIISHTANNTHDGMPMPHRNGPSSITTSFSSSASDSSSESFVDVPSSPPTRTFLPVSSQYHPILPSTSNDNIIPINYMFTPAMDFNAGMTDADFYQQPLHSSSYSSYFQNSGCGYEMPAAFDYAASSFGQAAAWVPGAWGAGGGFDGEELGPGSFTRKFE